MGIAKFIKQRLDANSSPDDFARVIGQLQDYIVTALQQVATSPIAQPILIPNVALAMGATLVRHTLGRPLVGWSVARLRAPAAISDAYDAQAVDRTVWITLVSSAPVVADLLFY